MKKEIPFEFPHSKEEVLSNLIFKFGTDVQYFFHSDKEKKKILRDSRWRPFGERACEKHFMDYLVKQANLIKTIEYGDENWKDLEGYCFQDRAFLLPRFRDPAVERIPLRKGTKSCLVVSILEALVKPKWKWKKYTITPYFSDAYFELFPDRREEVKEETMRYQPITLSLVKTGQLYCGNPSCE